VLFDQPVLFIFLHFVVENLNLSGNVNRAPA